MKILLTVSFLLAGVLASAQSKDSISFTTFKAEVYDRDSANRIWVLKKSGADSTQISFKFVPREVSFNGYRVEVFYRIPINKDGIVWIECYDHKYNQECAVELKYTTRMETVSLIYADSKIVYWRKPSY
jgi:hypothetical protein